MKRLVLIYLLLMLAGCSNNTGPATVSQKSSDTEKLSDRIEFVETYVNFKREYNNLEYDIQYHNNGTGRGAPGPSDWDIRLVAEVPPDQIEQWALSEPLGLNAPIPLWHKETAQEINVDNVNDWYVDGPRTVGLDRANSIIVYRNSTL